MTKNKNYHLLRAKRIVLHALCVYFIFFFLFITDYSPSYPILHWFNDPIKSPANALLRWVNDTYIHRPFYGNKLFFADSFWLFLIILLFLLLSFIISLIYARRDKGTGYPTLFKYVHVLARYYVASILFIYGITKTFGQQFGMVQPSTLIQPVGDLDPHSMLWAFMGASRSYQFLAGLIETLAGLLLLFRKTATLGSLISLPALVSVLMVNIAYDTWLKIVVVHLILFSFLIMAPDINRLYRFFILKQTTALTSVPPIIENKKYKWVHTACKSLVILLILFPILLWPLIKGDLPKLTQRNAPYYHLVGIHKIKAFQFNQSSEVTDSSLQWKKVAIDNYNQLAIQFQNDSIAQYNLEVDTASRSLQLTSLQDPSVKYQLQYAFTRPDEFVFTGRLKQGTVRLVTTRTKATEVNLLKGYGKVKWIYD